MTDYPFACCSHCMCVGLDREGHDDSCRFGCNEDAARVEADLNERRTNTRDRLNRLDHTGDGPFHRDAAINWLAWEHPDVINEALDNTGAPE